MFTQSAIVKCWVSVDQHRGTVAVPGLREGSRFACCRPGRRGGRGETGLRAEMIADGDQRRHCSCRVVFQKSGWRGRNARKQPTHETLAHVVFITPPNNGTGRRVSIFQLICDSSLLLDNARDGRAMTTAAVRQNRYGMSTTSGRCSHALTPQSASPSWTLLGWSGPLHAASVVGR